MKKMFRDLIVALTLLAFSTLNPQLSTCFAQGSLTPPPGVPAPTRLTLNQMEPRTPISAPYTITKPGSYYLTTNLTVTGADAIDINTSGVTLDLNGFTISSTSPFDGGTAILLNLVNYNNYTGSGIIASSASHSTAYQCGNTAISADNASDCYGYCTGSGEGLSAPIANSCAGSGNPPYSVTHPYNMP